jgi:hypothetical protein
MILILYPKSNESVNQSTGLIRLADDNDPMRNNSPIKDFRVPLSRIQYYNKTGISILYFPVYTMKFK